MYGPPNFISSSLFEFSGNHRFFGGLILYDGLGSLLAYYENKACFGSISGTKVYASAYE